MRVITGTARGKRLKTLEGLDVRPTSDRVKEAIFSILQFEIEGANILDLFAGSGQLGIETISRGARSVTFIDNNKQALAVVKENLTQLGFLAQSKVLFMNAEDFLLTTGDLFDIVFLDPPYSKDIINKLSGTLPRAISENSIIICETANTDIIPETIGKLNKRKDYIHGKVRITIYRKSEDV